MTAPQEGVLAELLAIVQPAGVPLKPGQMLGHHMRAGLYGQGSEAAPSPPNCELSLPASLITRPWCPRCTVRTPGKVVILMVLQEGLGVDVTFHCKCWWCQHGHQSLVVCDDVKLPSQQVRMERLHCLTSHDPALQSWPAVQLHHIA